MAEEKKQITLEQAKRWRLILRIAFVIVAFITPIVITCSQVHLFTQATKTKFSIVGVLIVLIVAWRFKKKIAEWINKWEDANVFKHILVGIGKVWPFALIVVLLFLINYTGNKIMNDMIFCLEWTCVCELIAYLAIYPFEMKMDYLVRRMIRKNERKADYKEAIKEMKEEEGNQ